MWPYTALPPARNVRTARCSFGGEKKGGGRARKGKGRNGERKGKKKGKEGMRRERKRKGKGTSRFLKVSLPLNHFKCSENAPEFLAM